MTFLTWITFALSCSSAVLCLGAWYAIRRSSTARLSAQLQELSEAQDSLNLQLRSVKVRLSALSKPRKDGKFATADDAEEGAIDPARNPVAWKRDMNLKIALGKVKP